MSASRLTPLPQATSFLALTEVHLLPFVRLILAIQSTSNNKGPERKPYSDPCFPLVAALRVRCAYPGYLSHLRVFRTSRPTSDV